MALLLDRKNTGNRIEGNKRMYRDRSERRRMKGKNEMSISSSNGTATGSEKHRNGD